MSTTDDTWQRIQWPREGLAAQGRDVDAWTSLYRA